MELLSRSDIVIGVAVGTIIGGMVLWIFGLLTEWWQGYDDDQTFE